MKVRALARAGILSLILGLAGAAVAAAAGKASSRRDGKAAGLAPREDRALRRVQDLLKGADEARERAQWARALQLYQQAYDLKPLPSIQHGIAECHRGMGNAARAAFAYRQYLKYAGEVDNRREVEELAVRMEELAAATRGGLAPDPAPSAEGADPAGKGGKDAWVPDGASADPKTPKTPKTGDAAGKGPTSQRPHRSRHRSSRAERKLQRM